MVSDQTQRKYPDMWVDPNDDPRSQEPTRGERDTLLDYLDFYRKTLVMKCDGLTPEQMATASVPPSNLTLLGLVRHMAAVEQSWFRRVMDRHLELDQPQLRRRLPARETEHHRAGLQGAVHRRQAGAGPGTGFDRGPGRSEHR